MEFAPIFSPNWQVDGGCPINGFSYFHFIFNGLRVSSEKNAYTPLRRSRHEKNCPEGQSSIEKPAAEVPRANLFLYILQRRIFRLQLGAANNAADEKDKLLFDNLGYNAGSYCPSAFTDSES